MINLKSLQAALNKVSDIGQREVEFEANGLKMAFRLLSEEEEIKVIKKSNESIGDGVEDQSDVFRMFYTHKIWALAYSLVQVDDQDLRGLKTIETGEVLPNGKKVKKLKEEVCKDLLSTWPRALLTRCLAKHMELLPAAEIAAEKAIELEDTNLDLEIERLEKRIVTLKELQEKFRVQLEDSQGKYMENMAKEEAGLMDKEEEEYQEKKDEGWSEETEAEAPVEEEVEEPEVKQEPLKMSPPPRRNPVPTPEIRTNQDVLTEKRRQILEANQRENAVAPPKTAQIPDPDGIEVFTFPAQVVGEKTGRTTDPGKAQVDKSPGTGATNPNFVPPKR